MGNLTSGRWALAAGVLLLGACAGMEMRVPAMRGPALDVLALDFERTAFEPGARVTGAVAGEQRALRVSVPTSGRLRHDATGPIPTEVLVRVTSLSTANGQVRMKGRLVLRDLAFGTTLAELEDFEGSGTMPVIQRGGSVAGLVFRGVEDEVLAWVSGLECDTRARRCGPPLVAETGTAGADGDLELAAMVGPRPAGTLGKLVRGGIDPDKVIAAAAAPAPVAQAGGVSKIGETVAALGLLDRSGFWLQTPLVSTESPGEVVLKATGKRISVTLVPKDGPAGGGSQISLAAMNALGADMTSLLDLEVYR